MELDFHGDRPQCAVGLADSEFAKVLRVVELQKRNLPGQPRGEGSGEDKIRAEKSEQAERDERHDQADPQGWENPQAAPLKVAFEIRWIPLERTGDQEAADHEKHRHARQQHQRVEDLFASWRELVDEARVPDGMHDHHLHRGQQADQIEIVEVVGGMTSVSGITSLSHVAAWGRHYRRIA